MLSSDATYKLDSILAMPENFTVEFDIIASADQVDDLSPLSFGFARDNSVKTSNDDGIASVQLLYFNTNEYTASSKDIDKYYSGRYNLTNTLNHPIHVSIAVHGTQMKVFLEKTKILDAKMFMPKSRKYFFITSPMYYYNGAKILIGNVRIAKK